MSLPQLPFTTTNSRQGTHTYNRAKERLATRETVPSTRSRTTPNSEHRGRTGGRRDRPGDVLIRDDDSELDSALSSPWTTLTSPSESEFETIENVPSLTPLFPTNSTSTSPPRSFSHSRTYHHVHASRRKAGESTPDYSMRPRTKREEVLFGETSEGGRDGDGDDEYSGVEGSRGRGRTRERRKKEEVMSVGTKLGMGSRNLLEEALRSSLATLLTLSSNPPTLSPAISYSSLSSLLSPHRSPGTFTPPQSRPDFRSTPSTFQLSLSQSITLSEPPSSITSDEDVSSSEGTELAPRPNWVRTSLSTLTRDRVDEGELERNLNLKDQGKEDPGGPRGNLWSWKWWKRTVEVKVWHLVGIAGIFVVGLGMTASRLWKDFVFNSTTQQRITLF